MIFFKRRCVVFYCVCFFSITAQGQLTDLARLEYSFIPQSKTDDDYTRLRFLLNYPIEIKKDDYLVIGADYNRIFLDLNENYPFRTEGLRRVHVIDFNLGYTFKWNDKLRFGVKFNPRIASTLSQKIESDDFFLNGGIFLINDRRKDTSLKRPFRLILGLTYNATTGIPFPLPFVSYFREINEKWSFNLGVPKSNIKRSLSSNSNLQIFVSLDGYLAHLQEPEIINGRNVDNISLSVAVLGLGYEYLFTKHLVGYLYTGYTLRLNNVLRDENRNEVFKLDDLNAFYLRTGLKFKI